jgi:uncharacterized protein YbbK (DUF523 family)
MRHLLLPLFDLYTRLIYRRLAKSTARMVKDYLVSGYSVVALVGIDGSPSCGVNVTMELGQSYELVADMMVEAITVEQMNALVRQCQSDGQGLFTAALRKELAKRHIEIPHYAHDLFTELEGKTSRVAEELSLREDEILRQATTEFENQGVSVT